MHEPYRTLLGHFRHEIGHYYWDRLHRDSRRIDGLPRAVRRRAAGLRRRRSQHHYETARRPDWHERFVSAYASAHPWEDWAETWAHYLHMIDTLETAAACGLSLRPRRRDEPSLRGADRGGSSAGVFDRLIDSWFPLTYVLNNLNRGLGLPDAYPFVLSPPAIEKLRFVHETVALLSSGTRASRPSERRIDSVGPTDGTGDQPALGSSLVTDVPPSHQKEDTGPGDGNIRLTT